MTNRLQERYTKEIAPSLIEKFSYKSSMQAPKIEKIVLNMGLGSEKDNAKGLEVAAGHRFEYPTALQHWSKFWYRVKSVTQVSLR